MKILRVTRNEERTRIDNVDELMGRGVQFPSGRIFMEWRLESYPPEDRLSHPHQSIYGSLEDLKQGTGGDVTVETEV